MRISFTLKAWEEYQYWQRTDKKIFKRINTLIKDVMRQPFEGIGKPEALKHDFPGCWSRRITEEHRLVYLIKHDVLVIVQCRYHY